MAENHLLQTQNGNGLKTDLYTGSMQQLTLQKAKSFLKDLLKPQLTPAEFKLLLHIVLLNVCLMGSSVFKRAD